jgi:hypothetical protein
MLCTRRSYRVSYLSSILIRFSILNARIGLSWSARVDLRFALMVVDRGRAPSFPVAPFRGTLRHAHLYEIELPEIGVP